MPLMNVARSMFGTCVVGGYLYVFCGRGDGVNEQLFLGMERLLLVESESEQREQAW